MWSGKENFKNFTSYFRSKGYECVTPGLLYHDIEPEEVPDPKLGRLSLTDYVDNLENEYKKIDDETIILGHSMGGLLAQQLAERVKPKALILMSSAPPKGINALTISVIRTYIGIILKPFFWLKPCRISFKPAKYAILNNLTQTMQKDEYRKFVYESGRVILQIGLPVFDKTKASFVDEKNITCPVLILHGMIDRIVPYMTGIRLLKKYSTNGILKLYKNNAHLLQKEDGWKDVAEYIYKWLKY